MPLLPAHPLRKSLLSAALLLGLRLGVHGQAAGLAPFQDPPRQPGRLGFAHHQLLPSAHGGPAGPIFCLIL